MQQAPKHKRSPLFLLSIGLGFTLIIILIMGWNIYWENLKQKQLVEAEQHNQQQYFQALSSGNTSLANSLAIRYPTNVASYSKAQQQLKEKLFYYQLDIVITLMIIALAILSLILSWIFILRTLLRWKKQIDSVNQTLEQHVADRTEKLNATNQQLTQEIEENKSLTEVLQRSQKLQAVGTLAAGIAHDYNNYLAVILAHSEFLQNKASSEAEQQASQNIIDTTHKASHLTQQLLTFARRGKHERKAININDSIVEAIKMLQPNMPHNINIDTHLEPSLWSTRADSNQILQILINLGLNARDAMPEGGNLIISSQNHDLTHATLLPDANLAKQKYVCITVKDFGVGIEPAKQPQIFDPFYTTKDIGKGTGLGLAVAYGIMRQHQGALTVTSDIKHEPGAMFTLYFPV